MTIKVSTGLANAVLDTESVKTALANGKIYIYAGPVPATADEALAGETLLVTITDDATAGGLDMEATAVNGVLSKAAAQTWRGIVAASGTAAYYRFVEDGADPSILSTTQKRVQGTVGLAGTDIVLGDINLVAAASQAIDFYNLAIPIAT